jgi:hypothetical protein
MLWMLASTAFLAGCSSGSRPAQEASNQGPVPPGLCNPHPTCPGSTCPTSVSPALTAMPADACSRHGEFQSDVDVFSWNSFIALNWPADLATCGPDAGQSILSGQGPTVWETFPLDSEVFVASGQQPVAWCTTASVAAAAARKPRVLGRARKLSQSAVEQFPGIDEAVGGVLTDQNGRFVRYEVRLNQDEYNYLTINNLWNAKGQQGVSIDFPQGPGDDPSRCGAQPCGPVGAVELKGAWKVLGPDEIASNRFYTTQAMVFNDEHGSASPGANPVTVGLVGLHILHKTEREASWFWSTFEHVDNTTSSFFNPDCLATQCPPNKQTAAKPYVELDASGQARNAPVQVTRVTALSDETVALNAYYQGLLKGSVWANYQLISTQWATGAAQEGTPAILANTTLETFKQSSSSCMGCHKSATTAVKTPADFSFLLSAAQ